MIVDPYIVLDDAVQYRASSVIVFHLRKRTLCRNVASPRDQLPFLRFRYGSQNPLPNPPHIPFRSSLPNPALNTQRFLKPCSQTLAFRIQAQGNLPGLSMAREQVQRGLGQAEAEHKSHVAAMEELKVEMDVHMNAYLKQENVGKEKAAVVQASFMEVRNLKARRAEVEEEARRGKRRIRKERKDGMRMNGGYQVLRCKKSKNISEDERL